MFFHILLTKLSLKPFIACFFVLVALAIRADAAQCKVKTAQGDVFDFGALASAETNAKVDSSVGDLELHSIFCGTSKASSPCIKSQAAFCLIESGEEYISVARWQQESDIKTATTTATGVRLEFENLKDGAFGSVYLTVEMNCAKTASPPVAGHPTTRPYTITYEQDHPAACKGAADSSGGGGLSGGSIFLIILLVSTFVYVAAGCALNWKLRGLALGKEACPQRAFWTAVASNCVAGVRFVASGCKKMNSYEASPEPAHEAL